MEMEYEPHGIPDMENDGFVTSDELDFSSSCNHTERGVI